MQDIFHAVKLYKRKETITDQVVSFFFSVLTCFIRNTYYWNLLFLASGVTSGAAPKFIPGL